MHRERIAKEYIKFVQNKKIYPDADNFEGAIRYSLPAICEEVGELHSIFTKSYRDGTPILWDKVDKELGDIIFQIIAFATDCGRDINLIVDKNVKKLIDRAERNVISGSGDDR